eukprot:1223444-Prymnesium_polylepis.1
MPPKPSWIPAEPSARMPRGSSCSTNAKPSDARGRSHSPVAALYTGGASGGGVAVNSNSASKPAATASGRWNHAPPARPIPLRSGVRSSTPFHTSASPTQLSNDSPPP